MERVNRTLAFVLMGFMIAAVGCGGAEPEEMVIEGEEAAAPEPVDPAAIAAAQDSGPPMRRWSQRSVAQLTSSTHSR